MKLTTSTVTKLRISDVPDMDLINAYLEDFHPGAGRIVIECYGKAWSAYWSHMGEWKTIRSFFVGCNPPYLMGKLAFDLPARVIDTSGIVAFCKKAMLKSRREKGLGKDDAARCWEEIDLYMEDDMHIEQIPPHLMVDIFGDEWWGQLPTMENRDYFYLRKIVTAVQQALRIEHDQAKQEAAA